MNGREYEKRKSLEGLIVEFDALERQVLELEIKFLSNKLEELDSQTSKMLDRLGVEFQKEVRSRVRTVAERFIDRVLTQYKDLLKSHCVAVERNLRIPYIDREDIMQDSLEYLLKWCLPKVQLYSSEDRLWMPYLKRSLHNCFVNQLKKAITQMRVSEITSTTYLHDYQGMLEDIDDPNVDVELDYEFAQFVQMTKDKLRPREKMLLSDILSPPLSLRTFITIYKATAGRTKHFSSRRALASYYNVPLTSLNSAFTAIKHAIEKTKTEVDYSY